MLDIKYILNNKDLIIKNFKKRKFLFDFDNFEKVFFELKQVKFEYDQKKAEQNQIKVFNEEAKELKEIVNALDFKKKNLEKKTNELLSELPNVIFENDKNAKDKEIFVSNHVLSKHNVTHDQIIKDLIMENEASVLSGSRFVVLKKELSKLKNALVSFYKEINEKNGYEEYSVPYIVNSSSLYGTGQLPKFAEDAFNLNEKQWIISTGEIPLVNLWSDYIFNKEDLPKLMMTYSPCFRKEAGSAGKDTKGLIRLHQFHKVELVTICLPENSEFFHKKQLNIACEILQKLKLPYRILDVGAEEIGFSATKQYDIEVWMPAMNKYVEIASCSNCLDFQSRRAKIKYKDKELKKNFYVHTLNGSSLPVERLIAAIAENFYNHEKKTFEVPEVLKKYY